MHLLVEFERAREAGRRSEDEMNKLQIERKSGL